MPQLWLCLLHLLLTELFARLGSQPCLCAGSTICAYNPMQLHNHVNTCMHICAMVCLFSAEPTHGKMASYISKSTGVPISMRSFRRLLSRQRSQCQSWTSGPHPVRQRLHRGVEL